MSTRSPRLRRAPMYFVVSAVASVIAILAVAGPAQAANKVGADIRVVTADGETLVDQRQYTGTEKVRTSPKADCFGDGTGGSGDKVSVPGPTALGAVSDAAEYTRALNPILLTDAFDFGIGICGFGGVVAPQTGYWYLKVDHVGSMTGGDQTVLNGGEDVLWYLIEDFNAPMPAELELEAPDSVKPGQDIKVRVFEYDDTGARSPAAGAEVGGVLTDAQGKATVPQAGATTRLIARRDGDIPSRALDVCSEQAISDCPNGHVLKIDGSDAKDRISSDKRPVVINAYGGKDKIDLRASNNSAPPIVKCGTGKDVVTVSPGQEFTARRSCERVKTA
jgi:hypothetical protein